MSFIAGVSRLTLFTVIFIPSHFDRTDWFAHTATFPHHFTRRSCRTLCEKMVIKKEKISTPESELERLRLLASVLLCYDGWESDRLRLDPEWMMGCCDSMKQALWPPWGNQRRSQLEGQGSSPHDCSVPFGRSHFSQRCSDVPEVSLLLKQTVWGRSDRLKPAGAPRF